MQAKEIFSIIYDIQYNTVLATSNNTMTIIGLEHYQQF